MIYTVETSDSPLRVGWSYGMEFPRRRVYRRPPDGVWELLADDDPESVAFSRVFDPTVDFS